MMGPARSVSGDYVTLRALRIDCVVSCQTCPQDMIPINRA